MEKFRRFYLFLTTPQLSSAQLRILKTRTRSTIYIFSEASLTHNVFFVDYFLIYVIFSSLFENIKIKKRILFIKLQIKFVQII